MYRPWGRLDWVLDKIGISDWDLFACISTEYRSLAAWNVLRKLGIREKKFAVIDDGVHAHSILSEAQINKREKLLSEHRKMVTDVETSESIKECNLFDTDEIIIRFGEECLRHFSKNVVLDITSFPKKYFFPLFKSCILNTNIENLIVVYSIPEKYTMGPLARDPEMWHCLPSFGETDLEDNNPELAFVGVGFMPFGLPSLLKNEYREVDVRVVFPFPSSPPSYQRNWEFMQELEKDFRTIQERQIIRVGTYDVNLAYDSFSDLTEGGGKKAIFAPYGPKPISLAMCLYATRHACPVYYTQPRAYDPSYSSGVAIIEGKELIYAYCIKLNGNNLYN